MSIFLNADNQPRSGWKLAAYIGFFLLLGAAAYLATSLFVQPRDSTQFADELLLLALNGVILFVPAVGAMWLTVKFMDKRPFSAFGIGFIPHWQRDLLVGLGIAAGMLTALMAGCYAFGYVSIHWTGGQAPPGILIGTLVVLLLSALNEELMFRGFPLQLLIDGVGRLPAMIGMSTLFGALHLTNPNASLLGTVNTIIAGFLLSLAYVRRRSLWLPYGIHVGWNVGLGYIFGFPLSGLDIASLWTTGIAGSETILGGGYGPEGGILATFCFGVATLFVKRYGSDNRTKAGSGGDTRRDHRSRAGES